MFPLAPTPPPPAPLRGIFQATTGHCLSSRCSYLSVMWHTIVCQHSVFVHRCAPECAAPRATGPLRVMSQPAHPQRLWRPRAAQSGAAHCCGGAGGGAGVLLPQVRLCGRATVVARATWEDISVLKQCRSNAWVPAAPVLLPWIGLCPALFNPAGTTAIVHHGCVRWCWAPMMG